MQYVVRLFDEKNVAALRTLESDDVSGTIEFLEQIMSWWDIVNLKSQNKAKHLRQQDCNPVLKDSSQDPNLKFLKHFCEWIRTWE